MFSALTDLLTYLITYLLAYLLTYERQCIFTCCSSRCSNQFNSLVLRTMNAGREAMRWSDAVASFIIYDMM